MAFGFIPARMRDGSPYNGSVQRCVIIAAGSNLFVGDPVTIGGTADAEGVPSVVKATAGTSNAIYGIVTGIDPVRTDLSKNYIASGATSYLYVETDPNVVYQATEDDGSLAVTDVGQNHNYVAGAGSTTTGISGSAIDSDTSAVTATLQLRLHGLAQTPGNVVGSATTVWEVTINNSNAVPNTAGI